MPLSLKDFDVICIIGVGGFGECRKVRRKSDKEIMVMKAIDYSYMDEKDKELICNEVNLLRKMNHPRILKYVGRIVDQETATLYIFTEFCEGGDLAKLIKQYRLSRKLIEEDFILKMFCQLINALLYCHHVGLEGKAILHRDIKPANVFLSESRDAILGDFGIARQLSLESKYARTIAGTYYYMSPEQLGKRGYDARTDVWSLGCLIYELCSLKPPFTASNMDQLRKNIMSGLYQPIASSYSDTMHRLIRKMLTVQVERRPSVMDLVSWSPIASYYEKYGKPDDANNNRASRAKSTPSKPPRHQPPKQSAQRATK